MHYILNYKINCHKMLYQLKSSQGMSKHLEFEGEWATVSSANLEPMLVSMGAPFVVRKAAPRAKPVQKISFNDTGLKMKIITETVFSSNDSTIILDGSQFESEMFGKKFVATGMVCEDGSIVVNGKLGDLSVMIRREMSVDGQMVLVTTLPDIECTRVFNRK